MKLLFAALAALLLAAPAPAYARTRPPPLPADVWVNPVDLGAPAYIAAAVMNGYTRTKFSCAVAGGVCVPAPCPSPRMCLIIRWADFTNDSLDARLDPMLCTTPCKAAVLEVNPEGPLFGGYNPWGPFQHRLLLERWMGVFAGLPLQSVCVSSMSHHSCSIEGFTPAEAAHLAGW